MTETTALMPAVTMLYAGLLGILLVVLALNVVRFRLGKKVGLGVGEGGLLEQPVRVHANFTENAPLFLVLLLVAELAGTGGTAAYGRGRVRHRARPARRGAQRQPGPVHWTFRRIAPHLADDPRPVRLPHRAFDSMT